VADRLLIGRTPDRSLSGCEPIAQRTIGLLRFREVSGQRLRLARDSIRKARFEGGGDPAMKLLARTAQ